MSDAFGKLIAASFRWCTLANHQPAPRFSICTVLFHEKVNFFGYVVSAKLIATDPDRIEAVQDCPIQWTYRKWKVFWAFVAITGDLLRTLDKLLNTAFLKRTSFSAHKNVNNLFSSPECQEAFNSPEKCSTMTPVLSNSENKGLFILDKDASQNSIGAVLSQIQEYQVVIGYLTNSRKILLL